MAQTLVVVVNGYGEDLLRPLLADDVLVENGIDFAWHGKLVAAFLGAVFLDFLANDVVTKIDAFIADENGRPGYQLTNFMLALAAEGAVKKLAAVV